MKLLILVIIALTTPNLFLAKRRFRRSAPKGIPFRGECKLFGPACDKNLDCTSRIDSEDGDTNICRRLEGLACKENSDCVNYTLCTNKKCTMKLS